MLKLLDRRYYRVKKGEDLNRIEKELGVPVCVLTSLNRLNEEVSPGQLLLLPEKRGNIHVVREGESKEMLYGSQREYFAWNGTDVFFIGMKIYLPS